MMALRPTESYQIRLPDNVLQEFDEGIVRCSMASPSPLATRIIAVAIALFNSSLRVIIFSALDSGHVHYFGTGTCE
jgi:hypothetical protein